MMGLPPGSTNETRQQHGLPSRLIVAHLSDLRRRLRPFLVSLPAWPLLLCLNTEYSSSFFSLNLLQLHAASVFDVNWKLR